MEFTIYDDDEVAQFLEGLEERPQRKVWMMHADGENGVCVFTVTLEGIFQNNIVILHCSSLPLRGFVAVCLSIVNEDCAALYH